MELIDTSSKGTSFDGVWISLSFKWWMKIFSLLEG